MFSDAGSLLHDTKLSSVVPKSVTGETAVHELTSMDLAMKLHYLRAVYYFNKEAADGIDILAIKKPMFHLLDIYCSTSGRVRRTDGGRPIVKCNDAGVRIMEVQCSKTMEEWLELSDEPLHKKLVPSQIVGPVVHFSPLVLMQFTWFKCGGMAVGLSWAHILGDAISATLFVNLWGQLLAGKPLLKEQFLPRTQVEKPEKSTKKPLSMKQLEPVGDRWIVTNQCNMETFSLTITDSMLKQLQSKIPTKVQPFDAISALIWKCLAKVREAQIVTICKYDAQDKGEGKLSNKQIISTVQVDFSAAKAELSELAKLIAGAKDDETKEMEAMVEADNGSCDYIVYGANLTFIDWGDADFYGLELKGKKPVHVSLSMDGVGDEGAVLVYKESGKAGEGAGRRVTAILPEDQVLQLRTELKTGLSIV